MKKAFFLCLFNLLFLCSCSSNHSKDVYFIHTLSFSENGNDGITLSAVMEKQSTGKDEKYFVGNAEGKDLDEAVEKMTDKYHECYFATNEIYIIPENADSDFLRMLTKICENPHLPSSPHVICVKDGDEQIILESIKEEKHLKKLLKQASGHKVSMVHLLAGCMSYGKSIELPIITLDNEGKPKALDKRAYFHGDKKMPRKKEN